MPNFVNPGSEAAAAIQQQMILRDQMRRQQLAEQLRIQEIEDRKAERAEDRAARDEQIRFQRNQAGVAEMRQAAQDAERQQRLQREDADRERALRDEANKRGVREMLGEAIMQGGDMTPERARGIMGTAIRGGVADDIPAIVSKAGFPDPDDEAYTLNPGDIRFKGGKEVARGAERFAPTPPAIHYEYFISPWTGEQIRIRQDNDAAINEALKKGWKKLTSAAERAGDDDSGLPALPGAGGGARRPGAAKSAEDLIKQYGGGQ